MTKKPGLKGRSKSIKAAMAAAGSGVSPEPVKEEVSRAEYQAETANVTSPGAEKKASPVVIAALTAAQNLPSDPEGIRILDERAEIYARPPKSRQTTHGGDAFIQVSFGGTDCYGIPFGHADEIVFAGDITPVPGTPPHIVGVTNLRGIFLTVVDLSSFFGLGSVPKGESRRIVVVSGEGMYFGILVARVDGSKSYIPEDLSPSVGGLGKMGSNFVRGVFSGSVAILDIAALIHDPALRVDHKGG